MHLRHVNHKNIHVKGSLNKLLVRRQGDRVQRTRHANEITLFEPIRGDVRIPIGDHTHGIGLRLMSRQLSPSMLLSQRCGRS